MKKIKRILAVVTMAGAVLTSSLSSASASPLSFKDVNDRYRPAVSYLWEEGIIYGILPEYFGTNQHVKRVDGAVVIARSIKINTPHDAKTAFTDLPKRAIPTVAALQKAGIVNGKTSTKFDPEAVLTRGEIALILSKAYNLPATTRESPFTDVPKRYKDAVNRLVESGAVMGKNATQFGTHERLTRGELALIIYRLNGTK
ncbi:hypothetical protein F9802_11060 [Bacillus aerolatus]|uniref:SLH domain-containing protein n=1 Tax=Bacillus aerolatus TaxID=2653354 RepID=A0A6I1FU78_9BACI|nr:S-layer homology domain-containing protein [Bacillus aerolatus]KAB7706123.1 hypothetical protein F9802_11060 [Bacillus aerolatus]